MAMTLILIFLITTIVFLLALIFLCKKKTSDYIKQLKTEVKNAEDQLQFHTMDVDNLILMLASIHEFGLTATGLMSKEELTQAVVDTACTLIHSDLASLMLINQDNELYILSSRGIPAKVADETRIKIGQGIAGKVASTGKHIFVENIETDIRFLRPNTSERYISKSFISVPLRVKNKVIGVLNINSPKSKTHFDDRDVKLLTILADQAAMTLDNMDLFNHLQSFYFEMVQTLARAIDAKDSYTYDHADRARKYAKAIAEEMNLPSAIVRHIEYAALMHDIGKIGISDQILSKPGKLTPEEIELIKKHPSIGNRIIAPVQFLSPVAPMVLYHQEWFNGAGYPEGLSSEEIPLGARIVAVIDAYDAMTSDRPYRKALSKGVAISELQKGSGTQFDPNIVKIFIDILNKES